MVANLVEQLKRDEGVRPKPYKDTVGKLTIGVGRNLDDVGLSDYEINVLLINDIKRSNDALTTHLPWVDRLDNFRLAVLQNMCFNMGIQRLLEFRRTLGLIQVGKYDEAATEMLNSAWAKQVGDRADRLSKQMREGKEYV